MSYFRANGIDPESNETKHLLETLILGSEYYVNDIYRLFGCFT